MEQFVKIRNRLRQRRTERFYFCIECGDKLIHKRGIPCQEKNCPNCGAKMLRVGSYQFRKWQKENAKYDK